MMLKNLFLLLIVAALLASGCASQQTQSETDAAVAPETTKVQEIEPWDGDGMEIPLDGSSREAWEASLARVKAHSDEATFITLENAIDYLLLYYLPAKHVFDKLIASLDGLNGYEVLARVNWRKPAPGKGPAEKGAADAKIIDS